MYQSLFIHSPSEGHLGHFQNLANMKKTAMSIPVLVFVVVQSPSCVQLFVTAWNAAHQASLSITNFRSLVRLMSIELMMPSNHLILCHTVLLLPSIFTSIRVFSNKSVLCTRWPNCWSFSFRNQAFQ